MCTLCSGDTLLQDNRQLIGMSYRTRRAGPEKLRLIGYTQIYSAEIVPAQEQHKYQWLRWCLLFPKDPMLRMYI